VIVEAGLAFIAGILGGIIFGIIPGVHVNLIASLITLNLGLFSFLSPLTVVIFITSLTFAQIIFDFIPSVYLGAPDDDSFLSVLPGHQMLKEGYGQQAVLLAIIGAILSIPLILTFSVLFIKFLPNVYVSIKTFIPFLLIFISIYLILRDDSPIISIWVFLCSGLLGFMTFSLPIKQPLIPLLTGLFGLSSLIISIKSKETIPKQKKFSLAMLPNKKEIISASIASITAIPFCSFLPGIGSGHAATIGSEIIPQNNRSFLIMIGILNATIMALSFSALYTIQKARTGSAAAISLLLREFSFYDLKILIFVIILSILISSVLAFFIAQYFSEIIDKISYSKLNLGVLIFLIVFNLIFTNYLGVIILIISTSLGILAIQNGVRRINLMAALIIPSIIYYFY
jgi:putative membrane protein